MAEAARPADLMRAFWQGFSTPSALAFRWFLAGLAGATAFCLWFFSETALSGPAGDYLPRSERNAEAFATVAALRAGREVPMQPRLFILGSSSMAQAIGGAETLRAELQQATGQDWEIVILTTPLQAPTDQFALLDRALASQRADSPPAVVVLGTGLTRLRWTAARTLDFAARPRLGLRSDWADAEITFLGGTPAPRRGLYLADNAGFVLVNGPTALLRALLLQPAPRWIDSFAEGTPGPRPTVRTRLGAEIRAASADMDPVLAQIGRLADRLASVPGTRLVFAEEPMSPGLVAAEGLQETQAALRAALTRMAAERGLGRVPVERDAGLGPADFFDDLHLRRGAAQVRFQAALARGLAGLFEDGAGHGG